MTLSELRMLREKHRISVLELAARLGIPADYVTKIEAQEIVALDSDLERIENAIRAIIRDAKSTGDS